VPVTKALLPASPGGVPIKKEYEVSEKSYQKPCYFCKVEDPNAEHYDPEKHSICMLCGVKLYEIAQQGQGLSFDMRDDSVYLVLGSYVRQAAEEGTQMGLRKFAESGGPTTVLEQKGAAIRLFRNLKEHRPDVVKKLLDRADHLSQRVNSEGPTEVFLMCESEEESEMLSADACIVIALELSGIPLSELDDEDE